ncbi:MAG: uroporphyrinogen-III C-methyltransferase [Nocardioidaceae bacterium]|nr:uroporphyrinogen-III C-methyltransferase [Nocardioidaceae bacterium]
MSDFPPYLSGLRLADRAVLVVGGGHVAQRRIPQLLGAGAKVRVVAPVVTPAIEGLQAELTWHRRPFEDTDLDGVWYVLALTDDPAINERVCALSESRQIFCVRSDEATLGTAWTPAVGREGDISVAVLGNRDPRRSAAVRDEVLTGLRDKTIAAPVHRHSDDGAAGVVLLGGGPGDPGLISISGRQALMAADVVVADRLAPRELLGDLPDDVELVDVAKLPRGRSAQQAEINRIIVERALAGKRVVRFKGGDNFVFGRGYEEGIACRQAGVPATVIPGLTSPVAVPAIAGIPVTHRGVTHEFTVVSGHLPPGDPGSLVDYDALGRMRGTIVVMMGVHHAPHIASALLHAGRRADEPVAVICDGTMPTQRTVLATLSTLAQRMGEEEVAAPAIIVIGEVVAVAHPEVFGG